MRRTLDRSLAPLIQSKQGNRNNNKKELEDSEAPGKAQTASRK